MKITKYKHACIVIEKDGQSLIIDPGEFTTDLVVPHDVTAVVITHAHADHLFTDHINEILDKNPDAVVYGHADVITELRTNTQAVIANEGVKAGVFELEFYGGQHALIDPSIPMVANLGVMVNNTLYYPGDSFTVPNRDVKVLALPVAAPWMKISESVAFAKMTNPAMIFPTHDAILSTAGKALVDRLIPTLLADTQIKYQRLVEPLEI